MMLLYNKNIMGVKMKINVKEFALLKDTNFEFSSKINIIGGVNAIGKTTLSRLIYYYATLLSINENVLLNLYKKTHTEMFVEWQMRVQINKNYINRAASSEETTEKIDELIFNLLNNIEIAGSIKEVNKLFYEFKSKLKNKMYSRYTERIFDFDEMKLPEKINDISDGLISLFRNRFFNLSSECFEEVTFDINGKNVTDIEIIKEKKSNDNSDNIRFENVIYIDTSKILYKLSSLDRYSSLNVNRKGKQYYFQTEIIDAIDFSKYFKPSDYLIDKIIENEKPKKVSDLLKLDKIDKYLNKIETIMGGKVVRKTGRIKFQLENGEELSLNNVASGIKIWILLTEILRASIIKKNSLVIIDEPEVHLHQNWILKFAQLLIELQKEFGFKLIISSHSGLFIKTIKYLTNDDEVSYHYLKKGTDGFSKYEKTKDPNNILVSLAEASYYFEEFLEDKDSKDE